MNTERVVPEWDRQRRDAGHYLVATSILCEHDWFTRHVDLRHRDDGPDTIDLEAIDDYAWSSGERTLINLFLTLAGWPRNATVRDVLSLDDRNRQAAGNAISLACANERYWQVGTASYREAF